MFIVLADNGTSQWVSGTFEIDLDAYAYLH